MGHWSDIGLPSSVKLKKHEVVGTHIVASDNVNYWAYMNILHCRPVSTGILQHSLRAFMARPGLWEYPFALKLPELLNTNLVTVGAKLWLPSSCPNGSQIWCSIGE